MGVFTKIIFISDFFLFMCLEFLFFFMRANQTVVLRILCVLKSRMNNPMNTIFY
jgi:hypothetical protein